MLRNFLELCERSYTGPALEKADWDMKVVRTVQTLVKKYGLAWDKKNIVPVDNDLNSRLWQGALELVCALGLYNMTTGRVIEFSLEEINSGLANMPQSLTLGLGKHSRQMNARLIEDERRPFFSAGNPGCPTPEELFLPITKSLVQEPLIDMVNSGSLTTVDGFQVRTGDVSEIVAVKREMQLVDLARRQCGRPGMPTMGAESAVSEAGDLCVSQKGYLNPYDAHLISIFNELIIDRGNLVRAAGSLEYGQINASLACTMVGGLAGDAPGAAMLMISSMMAANLLCLADFHLCHPIHIKHVATTTAPCLWLQSAVCQAFAQNAPAILMGDIWPKSGALTKELLYEMAANSLVLTVSGGHSQGAGAVDGRLPHGTGLESRLMAEVGLAALRTKLDRAEANKLVLKILAKYESVFERPEGNPGEPFTKSYDLNSLRPSAAWDEMYRTVKSDLAEMGLNFG